MSPIANLNLNAYFNTNKSFFHYLGGLTTPTCDEIVNWVVMEAVESISPAQLKTVKQFISKVYPAGNARSTKLLNARTIYYKNATATNTLVKVGTNNQSYIIINNFLSILGFFLIILI